MGSIFTCDGDNGQKCDMIGLQDAHNQECGHQGKFRASFSDNWGGAKPKFVSLRFTARKISESGIVVARTSDNGNACATKHFWGEADCGNAHAQDGVYMTAFKKLGVPKTIRICREATSDCTKAYTVPEGAVWEKPPNQGSRPGRESNSLALKLGAINPANKNTYYLVLARGGQGICINQRTDRANSIFTCDGDNGQKCDMIGLQDAHNQECGHQGKFRASFSDNWSGAKPDFVSLRFTARKSSKSNIVVARTSDNGNACAMKHFWGEEDCGKAHAQDGVYMTAFKKLGVPKTIRICREATSDCTKAYTVP